MPCRVKQSRARCVVAGTALLLAAAGCAGPGTSPGDAEAIRDFDFDNATVVFGGSEHELHDGHASVVNQPSAVGLYLVEGPVFGDVDDDGELDAAVIYEWQPASGSVVREAYVWLGDGRQPRQLEYPVTTGYQGTVEDVGATEEGFGLTMRPEPSPGQTGPGEKIVVAVEQGFPVQVKPVRGAVDRCDIPEGSTGEDVSDTKIRMAPDADAPQLAEATRFTRVTTVDSERNTDGWTLVRAERDGGEVSCGWVDTDET